jgi:DNA-binding MarR family transcriptional regulator
MSISGPSGTQPSRPAFERGSGFLLSRLGSLAARSWAELLRGHDLTLSQYVVLVVLDEQGPIGQMRLAQLVAVDPRNVVAVLDTLAARHLIERQVDEADSRRRVVALTRQGRRLVAAVARHAASGRDDFLGALSAAEQRQLNGLLQRLYEAHTDA